MRVKVGFAVDGREWTDPKTGKVRYFSSLSDSVRIDVCLEDGEWRRLVRKLRRAELEAWPDSGSAEGDAGASSWYLRMTSVGRNVEKFRPREMPVGAEYMREIVRSAFGRGGHFSVACDNGRAH